MQILEPKIAIFCPVHANPRMLKEQIENYDYLFGRNIAHFLHPSLEGNITFDVIKNWFPDRSDIFLSDIQQMTSCYTILGAYLALTEFLEQNFGDTFDFVYLHTDSDLLVKGYPSAFIRENRLGYSGSTPKRSWKWPYTEKVFHEKEFSELRQSQQISDDEILVGRHEGSFFPWNLWSEVSKIISQFYPPAYFQDTANHWPLEEVVISSLVGKLTDSKPHAPRIIETKELPQEKGNHYRRDRDENCIQVNDIEEYLKKPHYECLGLKWFSKNPDHPARNYLKKHLQN